MPTDSSGKFHMNPQMAKAASKPSKPKDGATDTPEMGQTPQHAGGGMTEVHDNGNGTFHTKAHDGEEMDHPHVGHMATHVAAKHGAGAKHMHVHNEGGKITTHHASEHGQVEGPTDHPDITAAQEHMGQMMGDNEQGNTQMPMHGMNDQEDGLSGM